MTESEKTSSYNTYNIYCSDTHGGLEDVAEVHTGYLDPETVEDGYIDVYNRGLMTASSDIAHVARSFCAALIGGAIGTWIARNVLKN